MSDNHGGLYNLIDAHEKRIAALVIEAEMKNKEIRKWKDAWKQADDESYQYAELEAELAELNAAVDIYMDEAWHHEDCPSYDGNTYTQCTCGYSALKEKGE